jgi:hypothetical protein
METIRRRRYKFYEDRVGDMVVGTKEANHEEERAKRQDRALT